MLLKLISDTKFTDVDGHVEEHPHLEWPQLPLQPLWSLLDLLSFLQQLFFSALAFDISFLQECLPEPHANDIEGISRKPSMTINMMWIFFMITKLTK